MRVLLSSVFGPYGVDDAYGRKENVMELFHNQVTRAQGIASLRFHHRSFGLYFLAENVSAPVTLLDFPTLARFEQELRTERYDAVGISFIVPNFSKAREMARLVRKHQPWAEIILGGHGDQMVPLTHRTSVSGIPIDELMDKKKLEEIVERTRQGGGEIVSLMGYSGYYAPAAGTVHMVSSILLDLKRVIPCSVYLTGQYGYHRLYMGVPVVLGWNGVERIIEMALSKEEKEMLDRSAEAVKQVVEVLGY